MPPSKNFIVNLSSYDKSNTTCRARNVTYTMTNNNICKEKICKEKIYKEKIYKEKPALIIGKNGIVPSSITLNNPI